MKTFLGILLLHVLLMCSSEAGIVTICPVDVAVQKKVNVTCAFGNEPFRDNFRIALVRKTNSSYEEDNVLTCQWYQAEHLCTTLPGYEYQRPITNKAVLFIENVSSENFGKYTCQRVPSGSGDISCEIKLSDITTVDFLGEPTKDDLQILEQHPAPQEETKLPVAVIVGVVVGIITIIIIGILISLKLYHTKRKRSRMSREQEMSKVTMLSPTQKEPVA